MDRRPEYLMYSILLSVLLLLIEVGQWTLSVFENAKRTYHPYEPLVIPRETSLATSGEYDE